MSECEAQRRYYEATADAYDDMHLTDGDEHFLALDWLSNIITQMKFMSLLDVGSGTGRSILYLKDKHSIPLVGIEPVAALREQGYRKGLSSDELVIGDALNLPYADDCFDVVCAFGVLHHIKLHQRAVAEMCRVARRAVFISDSNKFGQGPALKRLIKQVVHALRLTPAMDFVATKGKGYHYSEGDGIFYSYSVFYDLPIVRAKFPQLRFMNTIPSDGPNLYRDAPGLAMLGSRQLR